jgi:hypothetical protein
MRKTASRLLQQLKTSAAYKTQKLSPTEQKANLFKKNLSFSYGYLQSDVFFGNKGSQIEFFCSWRRIVKVLKVLRVAPPETRRRK